MKYIKTQKTYKAANVFVTIDHEAKHYVAYSYNWWQFVMVYNGKVLFNGHAYSPSTRQHQSKVRTVLAQNGVRIDHFVDSRASFTANWREDAIKRLEYKIVELSNQVGKKGSHKAKNVERLAEIERCRLKIGEIKSI
jgi:hypothetical protein